MLTGAGALDACLGCRAGPGRVAGAAVTRGEMLIRCRDRRAARRWPGRWRRARRRCGGVR
jgi:hypothetical protein